MVNISEKKDLDKVTKGSTISISLINKSKKKTEKDLKDKATSSESESNNESSIEENSEEVI